MKPQLNVTFSAFILVSLLATSQAFARAPVVPRNKSKPAVETSGPDSNESKAVNQDEKAQRDPNSVTQELPKP